MKPYWQLGAIQKAQNNAIWHAAHEAWLVGRARTALAVPAALPLPPVPGEYLGSTRPAPGDEIRRRIPLTVHSLEALAG